MEHLGQQPFEILSIIAVETSIMPLIRKSTYQPPRAFRNHHANTLFAGLLRNPGHMPFERRRIDTPDGDFLDLDCLIQHRDKALILLHGLEGHSKRPYMTGMANFARRNGFDIIAMNFRGCSGEPNLLPRTYHIGESGDLHTTVRYVIESLQYDHLGIIGFSVGGNITLKYLGEQGIRVPRAVKAAVTFSAPVHVPSSNGKIDQWYNWHYRKNLMDALNRKYLQKARLFPDLFPIPESGLPANFRQFDTLYTAPVNGYRSAEEYWDVNSSIHFIPGIKTPVLLVNARDDSFLSDQCYPEDLASPHDSFHLEIPEYGGHLGFVTNSPDGVYWSERRALEFLSGYM